MAKKEEETIEIVQPPIEEVQAFDATTKVDGEEKQKSRRQRSVFDRKSSKQKFEILGRKIKGKSGNVLKARREGFERRERTLLVEHKLSGKAERVRGFTVRRVR